jgi:HAD superfamily hydrolase (TIGR01509 family)
MVNAMNARGLRRAVLFDWDGTLVDSAEASFRSYVRAFEAFGIPFDRGRFAATYSPNWHNTYLAVGLPRDRWDAADALWREAYATHANRLVAGAAAALERLRSEGIAQAVVTSGERERVSRELAQLGVAGFFDATVFSEDARRRKPHPEALRLGLARLGVAAAHAAYVGDSPEDVEMARAAGVYSVGIPGGFPNHDALAAAAPDLLATDLEGAVRGLLARGR